MVLVLASAIGPRFQSVEFELAVPLQKRKLVDFAPFVDCGEEMDSVGVRGTVRFSDLGIFECGFLSIIYWLGSDIRYRCSH